MTSRELKPVVEMFHKEIFKEFDSLVHTQTQGIWTSATN